MIKDGTKRAIKRLLFFLGLMLAIAIIYGVIIECVVYFFGYWVGIAIRLAIIVILASCLGYIMIKEENKEEENEK